MRLLIARHGNTFDKGDVITRVGRLTDLPLSQSGSEQARVLGAFLQKHCQSIDMVYTSELVRTKETASLALAEIPRKPQIIPMALFNEIDYGVDENQPESVVKARVGEKALRDWDEHAILPEGWFLDISNLKKQLSLFLEKLSRENQTSLVVTSNGIARFIPLLEQVKTPNLIDLKMPTGSISQLSFVNNTWVIDYWGKKPSTVSI
jgi:probable phosphoglycerate mutase